MWKCQVATSSGCGQAASGGSVRQRALILQCAFILDLIIVDLSVELILDLSLQNLKMDPVLTPRGQFIIDQTFIAPPKMLMANHEYVHAFQYKTNSS